MLLLDMVVKSLKMWAAWQFKLLCEFARGRVPSMLTRGLCCCRRCVNSFSTKKKRIRGFKKSHRCVHTGFVELPTLCME